MALENNLEVAQGTPAPKGNSLFDEIMQGPPAQTTGDAPVVTTDVPPPGAVAVQPGATETPDKAFLPTGETQERSATPPQVAPDSALFPQGPGQPAIENNTTGQPGEAVTVVPGPPGQPDTATGPGQEVIMGPDGQPVAPDGQAVAPEGVEDRGNPNFRPDFEYKTEQGRAWKAVSDQRRQMPLEFNAQGRVVVEHGDCLSTIAERNLRGSGIAANRQTVEAEVASIVNLNRNRYPSLDANNHFIRDGWTLKVPRHQPGETVARPAPPQPPRVEAPIVERAPVASMPPETVRQPERTYDGRGNIIIRHADNVQINNGRQEQPPVVQNFPRPAGEPYYSGQQTTRPYYPEQEVVVQPRPRNVVVIRGGDDYGYEQDWRRQQDWGRDRWQQPRYQHHQPRLPAWVNQDCFGTGRNQGGWNQGGWNQGGWDQGGYDRNCRTNPRFAIDVGIGNNNRRQPFRPGYQGGYQGNRGGHHSRGGSGVQFSIRF